MVLRVFFVKQKTAYEMRISDWSSDVCSSDLLTFNQVALDLAANYSAEDADITLRLHEVLHPRVAADAALNKVYETIEMPLVPVLAQVERNGVKLDVPLLGKISLELAERRSEEHTYELQSLMRTSYAVFCIKKK